MLLEQAAIHVFDAPDIAEGDTSTGVTDARNRPASHRAGTRRHTPCYLAGMARPRQRPIWPSDDQVREQEDDHAFSADGRKVRDSERVGGMAPDADPEPPSPSARGLGPL